MIFGSAYVLSGVLITIAGRRNWKLKREKRPAKQEREEPVIGHGILREENTTDSTDETDAGRPNDQ